MPCRNALSEPHNLRRPISDAKHTYQAEDAVQANPLLPPEAHHEAQERLRRAGAPHAAGGRGFASRPRSASPGATPAPHPHKTPPTSPSLPTGPPDFFRDCLAARVTELKVGAQVLLLKNQRENRRLVNGSRWGASWVACSAPIAGLCVMPWALLYTPVTNSRAWLAP
jgi:hypothetical protein